MVKMLRENRILKTDSYKFSHFKQYPENTQHVYSYFESRGGRFDSTLFFGLQYLLKRYFSKPITEEELEEAKALVTQHLGSDTAFNEEGWRYIIDEHGGRLPVRIRAVPEGSVVPTHNVLMTVENTDPKCYWLTNYLETLLVQVWYPTTVATQSREIKKMIEKFLMSTATDEGQKSLPFKLHDFGFRGVSSSESAGIGGLAHLVNFLGTDNVEALVYGHDYYNEKCAGFSIPATEHSIMTALGEEGELNQMRRFFEQYAEFPIIACVSDSYDIFRACKEYWGDELKDKVMNRNGTLVVRPDSGDPETVVKQVFELLWDAFGGSVNKKGYKVLDSHIRVIQGDGVNYDSINEILTMMQEEGFSAENLAFGMGGALLQRLNRDTQRFAFKCSHVTIDGKGHDVWKDPVTDAGKASKKGRLKLIKVDGRLMTVKEDSHPDEIDILETVFENGKLLREHTLADIRKTADLK